MKQRRKKDEGVALILALLFIVLLTVLVVEFSYEAHVEASYTQSQGADFHAWIAAKSGVAQGISLLAEDQLEFELGGGLGGAQGGAQGSGSAQQPAFDAPVDSYLDPVPWHIGIPFQPLNEAVMRSTISDEYGKLNLNALLQSTGEGQMTERAWLVNTLINFLQYRAENNEVPPEAIVDSILDWMDFDDDDEVRGEGAENDYYTGLETPYLAKNGPMDSLEELLLIKGITPELYYGNPEEEQLPLSAYLTVHGDWDGRINVNTAELELLMSVLEANGGDPAAAEEIYESVRSDLPYTDVTQLDGLFPEQEAAQEEARQQQLEQQQRQNIQQNGVQQTSIASEIFTVSSNVFRIHGDGKSEEAMVRVEAFVYRTGSVSTGVPGSASEQVPPPEEPFRVLSYAIFR